jgi:hypothetical protein
MNGKHLILVWYGNSNELGRCQSDEFDRNPTEDEVEFGKQHGVSALIEYTYGWWKPPSSDKVGIHQGKRMGASGNWRPRQKREGGNDRKKWKGINSAGGAESSIFESSAGTSLSNEGDEEGIEKDLRDSSNSEEASEQGDEDGGGEVWEHGF